MFTFFDPPYYEQGKNLYTNFFKHEDHLNLQGKINNLTEYYWILTYDNKEEILSIYEDYSKYLYSINYSASNVRKAKETIIPSIKVKLDSLDSINIETI